MTPPPADLTDRRLAAQIALSRILARREGGRSSLRKSIAGTLGLHAAFALPIQFAERTIGVIQFFQ